jgi:hypothetical protein
MASSFFRPFDKKGHYTHSVSHQRQFTNNEFLVFQSQIITWEQGICNKLVFASTFSSSYYINEKKNIIKFCPS